MKASTRIDIEAAAELVVFLVSFAACISFIYYVMTCFPG